MPVLEPIQNRTAGEHVTGPTPAPTRGQGQATRYDVNFDLDPAEQSDPTFVLTNLTVEGNVTDDVWTVYSQSGSWAGSPVVQRDGTLSVPHVGFMASDNRNLARVRVRWTQNRAARVGITMDATRVDLAP